MSTPPVTKINNLLLVAGGSNADELSSSGEFQASSGPVAFRLDASHRDADEFEFDGGVAGNSQYEVDTGIAGVSLIGPVGAVGVSYRRYEADYGIPVSEDGEAIPGGDPGVTLDLEQDSYKLLGRSADPSAASRERACRWQGATTLTPRSRTRATWRRSSTSTPRKYGRT